MTRRSSTRWRRTEGVEGADEGGSRLADEEVLDAVEPADVTAALVRS